MSLDPTAVGIAIGGVLCAVYACASLWRKKDVNLGSLWAIVASGLSIPVGSSLIRAGLSGKSDHLPSSWREYVATAGILAIGVGFRYLLRAFAAVTRKNTRALEESEADE